MKTGSQPFYNSDRTISVVFNGEIYNFKELRNDLIKEGYTFRSQTDTEVIVYLYEKYGIPFVELLNGMFAIAIWDNNSKKLILIRDRLGIKPLYYTYQNNILYFTSELFSFKTNYNIKLEIQPESVDAFLAYRSVPAPLTIYKDVYKLLPGELLIYSDDNIANKKYWRLNFQPDNSKDIEDFVEEFIELLKKAVQLQSFSDAPFGCFLSGGIDSSLITALAVTNGITDLKTFSMRPGSGYYDELGYARQVAEKYHTNHIEFEMPDTFENDIEKIINGFDEPFSHHTMIPTYYLARGAKQYADAVLSGEGADEIFAGYGRYRSELLAKIIKNKPSLLKHSIDFSLQLLKSFVSIDSQQRSKIERAIKKMSLIDIDEDLRFVRHFQMFNSLERQKLFANDYFPNSGKSDNIYLDRMKTEKGYFTKRYAIDINTWLHDQMLTKVDRMTMAHSLEARVPFLDHNLVEFSATIPENLKFTLKRSKIIVREAAKIYLPKTIFKRAKHGFAVPVDQMFRGELKEFMFDMIHLGKRDHYFLNYQQIDNIIKEHLNNKRNHGYQILSIVSLICWLNNNKC